MPPYIVYGWRLSYFSGKLHSYLRFKNIPFVENNPNVLTLYGKIKEKTGAVVMPVLTTPEGEWLQDTRNIINLLEKRFPDAPSVFPSTPKRMFISSLFEAWGDEWWIPIAMHYRWNYPESVAMFMEEAGDSLMPYTPRFVKNLIADKTAKTLIGYLPFVGVVPGQIPMIEAWTESTLAALDTHFKSHNYLVGSALPTIGDLGLMGPLLAHLSRDPWPRVHLISKYPNISAWLTRVQTPYTEHEAAARGHALDLLDDIPSTLLPIISLIFKEFTPQIEGTLGQLEDVLVDWPKDQLLRKTLSREQISFPMGSSMFKRQCNPHLLYKTQGVLDVYHNLDVAAKQDLASFIGHLGGESFLNLKIPKLERVALQIKVCEERKEEEEENN